MFTFDIRGKHGILIFTLYNYRLGEGREYYAGYSLPKRLNSYAFYNTETNELRIVHYDYIKARIYDGTIAAYTIIPGERIIGLRGSSCYYLDHNGQEVGYAGDSFFFSNYQVEDNKSEVPDILVEERGIKNNKYQEEKSDFIIDGNKIIYDNGEIYESKYSLEEVVGNVIVCYLDTEANPYENRLYGICDNKGNLLSAVKYDKIYTCYYQIIRDKYLRVEINADCGIISFDGKEVLPVEYEYVDDCDGRIAVVNYGEQLININDLSVLFETKDIILNIVDGWMGVVERCSATSLGLLDSSGKFYEFFEKRGYWRQQDKVMYNALGASFHDGLLPVFSENRGYGYVDIDSNEVIECKYCEISDFENGKAKVRLDCEYGYINTKGCMLVHKDGKEIAIPNKYDWAYDYKSGYCIVQKGKLFGAIDVYMNEIIPCSLKTKEEVERTYLKIKLHSQFFSEYEETYKELFPPIRFDENNLFGFKSANGDLLFPPVLRVGDFVEGMAKINVMGEYGYINEKLELIIPPQYNNAEDFSEGLALVKKVGECHKFINKLGEVVISCGGQEKIESFHNGVAKCEYNPCTPGKDNVDDEITKYKIGYRITW